MTNKSSKWLIFPIAVVLAAVLVGAAFAQGTGTPPPPSEDEVNAIAKNMYCPVCESTPLDVCPTLACAQWREQIREKLTLGWSEEEIYDFFVEQYGDRVLAEPPRRGFNWLMYVGPPLFILVAAIFLGRQMRAWRQAPAPAVDTADGADQTPGDDYVSRIEAELKKRQ
ncbi:MAG: cytochrome c-type biogenesis protein CcmH [Anaerolineae bacterium]|nr:cytochrome c-type biogenesis protein CcmH [Anaerolineae bacterium]